MIDTFSLSPDGLTWTFALRDGLKFSNGTELTTADVVGSFKRWYEMSAGGQFLNDYLVEGGMKALDDRTWTMEFNESIGTLPSAMAWAYKGYYIFDDAMAAMPATQDASEGDIANLVGSGPFKVAKWDVGDKVIIDRYEDYVPRSDGGTYLAGGKIAYMDSITWLEIPSEETKIAGLKTGEWDMVDGAGLDHFASMVAHPGINVATYPFHKSFLGVSHSDYPTSDVRARQAIQVALDWEEMMASLGPSDLWHLCSAVYYCDTAFETDIGASEYFNQNDIPRAKALLADMNYDGSPLLVYNPQDYATIAPQGPVLKARLEDIGMEIEMPGMDWSTLVSKIYNPGYNIFLAWSQQSSYGHPFHDRNLVEGGTGYAGGFTLPDMVEARLKFAFAQTYAEQMKYVEELQMLYWTQIPRIYGGQFASIYPHAAYVKNLTHYGWPIYTNLWMEK